MASTSSFIDRDTLRTKFAAAMSTMYRQEVPLYGDLVEIVRDVNTRVLQSIESTGNKTDASAIHATDERLTLERHGAIRLGTPFELGTVKRIFRLLGIHPVGYYDLTIAGLRMHATCFRPTELSNLDRNPFRVFTTLLRPELVGPEARVLALDLLNQRMIFSDALLKLLDVLEDQGGNVTQDQTEPFIAEALRTFGWQCTAAATIEQYKILKAENPVLADIASFTSAHINHLTPRALDISAVQSAMKSTGIAVKERIEGPPPRNCPILLRQTSFLALEEPVAFKSSPSSSIRGGDEAPSNPDWVMSSHRARFGEIEQRGAAVTPKGRQLYDKLLGESAKKANGLSSEAADALVIDTFKQYPDTWTELRKQGLIYCVYNCVKPHPQSLEAGRDGISVLEQLIADGFVEVSPITYEDFLPLSAAGIFQSNLQSGKQSGGLLDSSGSLADIKGLEGALGTDILDLDKWYATLQQQSLKKVAMQLGVDL